MCFFFFFFFLSEFDLKVDEGNGRTAAPIISRDRNYGKSTAEGGRSNIWICMNICIYTISRGLRNIFASLVVGGVYLLSEFD